MENGSINVGTHGNGIGVDICASNRSPFTQHLGTLNLVNGAGAVGDQTITVDNQDETDATIAVGDIISFQTNNSVTVIQMNLLQLSSKLLVVDGNSGTIRQLDKELSMVVYQTEM